MTNISVTDINDFTSNDIIKTINYYLNDYWLQECDPRTRDYWLARDGPQWLAVVMFSWLLFVTRIGPHLMANRKPFELRTVMFAYNVFMVLSNAYFFLLSIRWLGYGRRLFEFEFPSAADKSAGTLQQIDETVLYAYTKFVDLVDTVFFVLRKKHSHLTFLHLYHHFMVPVLGWAAIKLGPTCQPLAVFAILNTLVHTIMYSYYALSAFGPSVQPYLWWKRYITLIQITQFVLFVSYGLVSAYLSTGWPRGLYWIGWIQNPLFLMLFLNFYRQSYNKCNRNNHKTHINSKLCN
ncbi:elongation of very long chain fatty acids protein 7-like [Oppia nitens]|uniref:elongation of very long chain fatty acids protein 7-like n=1 Tax=Oppia nitens TaxID=1686743 RepID=UPI0023D99CB0|nr:elongation of very long chain fatty acids protein 7-like [Oppia nitens]